MTDRASARKFTDIVVRDYSIYAESPMKVLVLSRFDIFHLMSPEARASLQRSALGSVRESIEARALKSMAWEKYKKRFFNELLHAPKPSGPGQGLRSPAKLDPPTAELTKSLSVPVLSSGKLLSRSLVDPGALMLVCRRDLQPNHIGLGSPVSPSKQRGRQDSPVARPTLTDDVLPKANTDEKTSTTASAPEESELTAPTTDEAGIETEEGQATSSDALLVRSASMPVLDRILEKTLSCPDGIGKEDGPMKTPVSRSPPSKGQRRVAHRRSTPNVVPEIPTTDGKDSLPAVTPPTSKVLAPPRIRIGHRRLSSQRTDKHDSSLHLARGAASSLPTGTPTIWDPVHGVCQPFAVVGFMKEAASIRPMSTLSDVKPSKVGKPSTSSDRRAPSELAGGSSVATGSASSLSSTSIPQNRPTSSHLTEEITRFRVFGKLRDINDAMDLFRRICAVETSTDTSDGADRSQFAIYKEAEMTMVLGNFPSTTAVDGAVARQFGASDLPQANGQRFACVGVMTASDTGAASLTAVESAVVHVYQCFPTPQSAVRFARQISAALLSACPTHIVPLFEWIPLAEIERFDARNAELEQALE